jgi:hypothetical protein
VQEPQKDACQTAARSNSVRHLSHRRPPLPIRNQGSACLWARTAQAPLDSFRGGVHASVGVQCQSGHGLMIRFLCAFLCGERKYRQSCCASPVLTVAAKTRSKEKVLVASRRCDCASARVDMSPCVHAEFIHSMCADLRKACFRTRPHTLRNATKAR